MPEMSASKAPSWVARLVVPALVALAALTAPAAAQVPGEYPHFSLSDRLNPDVPGPAGPWDNSHVFQGFSGMSFDAKIAYQSAGQVNTHVFWAALVSVNPTPFPKNLLPPKLLTMPPFIVVMPPSPTLNAQGKAQMTLFVPAGLFAVDAYVQGLVYDSTHVPPMQLSNGLKVDIDVPGLSVDFAFVRNEELGAEGRLGDAGVIDIDGSRLNTLKPLGPNPPPAPFDTDTPPPGTSVQVANPVGNFFSFLPILSNAPDEPVNPLARPLTTITGAVTSTATTIPVTDTTGFPKRGKLLISLGSANFFWGNRIDGTVDVPNIEVVLYDGTTATSFLNCQRGQVGTQTGDDPTVMVHVVGDVVAGEFTMATTAGARQRTRVSLDVDNADLPHVVLPDITVASTGEGGGSVTRSLDLYRAERAIDKQQTFLTFDRVSGTWTTIPGTERSPTAQGVWDPMICVAPDNKSFIAVLRVNSGVFGWNNDPDEIWAVRLDGQNWKASGAPTWKLNYQLGPPPLNGADSGIQSRRPIPRCFAIIGPNPDNYVLYAGLAYKWRYNDFAPGSAGSPVQGFEAEYLREEVLVKDLVECPLVPPGSTKAPPAMPRPYITTQFGNTGTGFPIARFDPEMLASADHTRLLLVGGRFETEEDAFVIRNVAITAAGAVTKTLVNVSGATDARTIRAMSNGGHGQGGKAAFSPNGLRVAFVARAIGGSNQKRDWLNVGLASGASYGQVKHIYSTPVALPTDTPDFTQDGAYKTDRVISNLRFIDNNRIVFLMGRNPYDDPIGANVANAPAMDWFIYDVTTGVMTNLSRTYSKNAATQFTSLGVLAPAGSFSSPSGDYTYLVRFGGIGAGEGSSLPEGTAVANILGLSHATLGVFPVTGDELGLSPVPNLTLPAVECRAPVETAAAMRFTEATGVQSSMLYFTAHVANGNGSDEIFALNRDAPFVTLQATSTALSGVHVRNVVPDPYSGKVAFSRSGTAALNAANEHPYVVDLDHFLFERDVLPTWSVGGNPIGRVMDGSFHFIAPSGSADEALVFSFGLLVMPNGGIAQSAPPAYYPLATVSDPLAEPIPVLIPLIDTALLGGDFRFYLLNAGPSKGD